MSRSDSPQTEVLIVTDASAAAAALASVVHERSNAGSCHFTLLVPAVAHGLHRVVDPEDQCCAEAEQTIRALQPTLEAAAGHAIRIVIGSHDPMAAIQDALNAQEFTEIILATTSSRPARWTRLDLSSKVRALGVPMTTIRLTPGPLLAA